MSSTESGKKPDTTHRPDGKQKAGKAPYRKDPVKKFLGHDKGSMEGIVITENGGLQQYTDFKERLETVGGSQYHPKVGLSIQELKVFSSVDFVSDIVAPGPELFTSSDGTVDADLKRTLEEFYEMELKEAAKDLSRYRNDMGKIYSLAMGQLDTGTKEALKSQAVWEDINKNRDIVKLLALIRDLCYQGNKSKVHPPTNILRAMRKLFCSRQHDLNSAEYAKAVTEAFEVVRSLRGSFISEALIKYELDTGDKTYNISTYDEYLKAKPNEKKLVDDAVVRTFLATIMVEGSDEDGSTLKKTLSEQYCLGQNQYPQTTTRAMEMLGEFKSATRKSQNKQSKSSRSTAPQGKPKIDETNAFTTKGVESTGQQVLMKAVEDDEDFGDVSRYHSFFMLGEDGSAAVDDVPTPSSSEDEASIDEDWDYWATRDEVGVCQTQSNANVQPDVEVSQVAHLTENAGVESPQSAGVDNVKYEVGENTDSTMAGTQTTNNNDAGASLNHKERIDGLDLAYSPKQGLRFGITETFYYSQNVMMLAHAQEGKVNPNWILLDSESSVNLITNRDMVTNIRKADDERFISIHCNAGTAYTDQWAELAGFGTVWFYEDGIANVLSLALVTDSYRVTMDSTIDNALHVHKSDGTTRRFSRSACNLYYTDMTEESGNLFTITTVEGNKENFSDLDRRRAETARKLQEHVGFPTSQELTRIIDNKLWNNCGVTRRDVKLAEAIYGKNRTIVQGKSVRQTSSHIREDKLPVPDSILERYGDNVSIHVDIFTVNGVKFFHSISRHLKFRTVRYIEDMKQSTLMDCVSTIVGLYASRGFQVRQVFGDNQFACLTNALVSNMGHPIVMHCVPSGQHEPTVERSIRTVKDNARCLFNHIPFKRLPKRCIIELVYTAVFWLNSRSSGVSKHHSAREIMTGIPIDVDRDTKHQFLEPIMAHVDDTDNSMSPRALLCLYLRPTGNATGGFFAYNPDTGKVLHRHRASPTPLTQDVIDKLVATANRQQMSEGVHFGDAEGNLTIHDIDQSDDDDEDDDYQDDDGLSVDTELTGVIINNPEDMDPKGAELPDEDGGNNGVDVDNTLEDVEDAESNTVETNDEEASTNHDHEDVQVNAEEADEDHNDAHTQGRREGLRPTVTRTHNKFGASEGFEATTHTRSLFTHGYHAAARKIEADYNAIVLATAAIEQYNNLDASQVTQQYGVKKGIKLFGEAGVDAVLKELKQFHDMKVGEVVDPKSLDRDTINKALPYLMFLKRKRCGKIKGRGCADGRKQREFITKEEAFSPTVSLQALMLSCLQDAVEGRDVATADIPGAFLQTDMPEGEDVYIRMDGTMAELLCRVDPKTYRPYLKIDKSGKKVLFTKAKKAIYGTLRAALLFWENLSGKLSEWGFVMNPYDSCTMNKIINGKQCTIVWHVDDLKISHVDSKVVDRILDDLNKTYGLVSPLTVTRGKVHDYVGMTIDYSEAGKVKFSMFDYIEDIIQNLPKDLQGEAVTPAADHLFKINEAADKLSPENADTFHHYVAKLLFAAKRARPDIQTAVAFLCTRVKSPDVDDWKKLKRVMGYISNTPFIPLVLGCDKSGNAHWHVDAAFAVHEDMRSHTGGSLTFGTGTIIGNSLKQKLNTTSSTEAEVVGVHNNMPYICWVRYFLTAQQQHMTDNGCTEDGKNGIYQNTVLYQDNTSAMRLEKNGKASSTKRTRHIHIRYFFITDKVKKGEITIEYCPTDDMVADYFTKPLQGAKFRKFRNTVMGITDAEYLRYSQEYRAVKAARMSQQG